MVCFYVVLPLQLHASFEEKAWWEGMEMLEIFSYRTVAVVHFTDQNWISNTIYCIRCVMVCKIGFCQLKRKNRTFACRAFMVVTYYIKLFRVGADRHNGILMSLLLLAAETITTTCIWISEAAPQRCSAKKVFLKISQNSQQNTFARVSYWKSCGPQAVFLWILLNILCRTLFI